MDEEICQECTSKCAQFMCCVCNYKYVCECAKVAPPDEEE